MTNIVRTLYRTVLYHTVLCCTVLYCTVLYRTVLYCTVLLFTVLYCTGEPPAHRQAVPGHGDQEHALPRLRVCPRRGDIW